MANKNNKGSKSSPKASPAPVKAEAAEVKAAEPEPVYEGKAGTESRSQAGNLITVKLSTIDAESFDNQRSGDFTAGGDSKDDGSDQSFAELVASIDQVGQKDPVTARYKPGAKAGQPGSLQLVKGFRRYAAIRLIGQRDGIEDPEINVICKELSDLEALEENVFENTARDNLTGPDLAWAAYNLEQRYKADGIAVSDNLLAKRMGKNQSYISKIKKIVVNAPVVARAWRESRAPLTVDAMKRISELPQEEQEAEYQRVNEAMGGKGNARGTTKPPVETAKTQATKIATLLGNLAGQGLIKVDINWQADLAHIGVKIKDLTVQDIRGIAKHAQSVFEKAATAKKPDVAAAADAATASADN